MEDDGDKEKQEEPKQEIPEQSIPPKPETPPPPPTDFRIAEIWIKSGQIFLEGVESFWSDRCRALGVLEFCKDIVKTAQMPKKPDIVVPDNGRMLRYARNLFKRRR